jgi:hypothetical protein
MTTSSRPSDDDTALGAAVGGAQGLMGRVLWTVGTILAVATITDLLHHHHHGVGPYLLAAAFLLLFLAALDMWRAERAKARRATRTGRRFSARVDRLEDKVRFLEQDRDEWRRMQAEEAAANRRQSEEIGRLERQLQPRQPPRLNSRSSIRQNLRPPNGGHPGTHGAVLRRISPASSTKTRTEPGR